MCEAVNTISDVAQGRHSSGMSSYEGNGELAAALDDFDDQVDDSLSSSDILITGHSLMLVSWVM